MKRSEEEILSVLAAMQMRADEDKSRQRERVHEQQAWRQRLELMVKEVIRPNLDRWSVRFKEAVVHDVYELISLPIGPGKHAQSRSVEHLASLRFLLPSNDRFVEDRFVTFAHDTRLSEIFVYAQVGSLRKRNESVCDVSDASCLYAAHKPVSAFFAADDNHLSRESAQTIRDMVDEAVGRLMP